MNPYLSLAFLSVLIPAAFGADPDGFAIWKPAELRDRQTALHAKVGPDNSARETLGNYGNHMVRMLHRVADGAPEYHQSFIDMWIVVSGGGTLVVGGTLVDPKPLGGEGDLTGTSINGGERHEVAQGDIIHIPPRTAHEVLVPSGKQITYLRVAIPAP